MRNEHDIKKSFTLIELLIVVAIISILLTILLPALRSARERARRIFCLNNQRNIYNGASLFAFDYDNKLPAGSEVGSNPGLVALLDFDVKPIWYSVFPNGKYTWTRLYYKEYLKIKLTSTSISGQNNILYCPSNPGKKILSGFTRISYCTPGLSAYQTSQNYPFALATTKLWEKSYTKNRRAFSFDASAYTSYTSAPNEHVVYVFKNTPHKNSKQLAGMNVVTTDGSGEWVKVVDCRKIGTSGAWVYYDRAVPRDYEVTSDVHRNYGFMKSGNFQYTGPIPNAPIYYTSGNTSSGAQLKYFGYFQP